MGNIDWIKVFVVGEVPFHLKLRLPPFAMSCEPEPEAVKVIVPAPDPVQFGGCANPVVVEPVNAVALTTILFMVLKENAELFMVRVNVVNVLLEHVVGVS